MKKLFILLLLFSFSANAAKVIDKDTPAPYKGVLFTMEEEKELRKTKEENIKLKDLRILHEKKAELQDLRIQNYKQYVEDTRPLNNWQKAGYFLLGVLATSASIYAGVVVVKYVK